MPLPNDFTHAYNAFANTMQGVRLCRGFLDAGVKDNEIIIFSELMDAKSLFLTANADTVYFLGFIDVSKGPMVFEVPPKVLGALDDMWFRWVTDFGQLENKAIRNQRSHRLSSSQRFTRSSPAASEHP